MTESNSSSNQHKGGCMKKHLMGGIGVCGIDLRHYISDGVMQFVAYPECSIEKEDYQNGVYNEVERDRVSYKTSMFRALTKADRWWSVGQLVLEVYFGQVGRYNPLESTTIYKELFNDIDFCKWLSTLVSEWGEAKVADVHKRQVSLHRMCTWYKYTPWAKSYDIDDLFNRLGEDVANNHPRNQAELDMFHLLYRTQMEYDQEIVDRWTKLRNDCDDMEDTLSRAKVAERVFRAALQVDANIWKYFKAPVPRDDESGGDYATVSRILRSGVSLKSMLTYLDLTKSEFKEIREQIEDNGWRKEFIKIKIIKSLYPEIPDAWRQYIKTKKVGEWANNKRAQLQKTRSIQGPGNHIITIHYHTFLSYITDDMLVNGPKTSWKKVYAQLQDIQQEMINEQLRDLVHFDVLDKPDGFDDIYQLTDSFMLRDEGDRMNHCVGSYIHACKEGTSVIYHIDVPEPHGATFEISKKDDSYRLCQIYGLNDHIVPDSVLDRASAFVRALNKL